MTNATDISRLLAQRIDQLVRDMLPIGHREGHEWRAGSIVGEPGHSLGVHIGTGPKRGIWSDFAASIGGDALDLVSAVLGLDTGEAITWSRRWLGLEAGETAVPRRPASVGSEPALDPNRWRKPWSAARLIGNTIAETYLNHRGLQYLDLEGQTLRFHPSRGRKGPTDQFEHHPALLVALSDAHTGDQVGVINVFLKPDGSDRLRDQKGKTCTGRASGAVVMLSAFDEPTVGLTICEGTETGVALLMKEQAPVWACGGARTLATFPVLSGIEALTIAADADVPGKKAAIACAARWRAAKRAVVISAPPVGDWADDDEEVSP
jgi:putative DNA primase/helicase